MQANPDLIYELIITVINVLSIIANVLLIITILRSRLMRSRTNMYILNVAIADLLTLIVLLVYYIDKRLVRYTTTLPDNRHFQCVLANLEISLQIITMLFVIIMTTTTATCISQGILVVLVWNAAVVASYFNVLYCKDNWSLLQGAIYAILMTALLLILLVKSCRRCHRAEITSRDDAFRLNFATIFVCLCLASWIVNILAEFGIRQEAAIVRQFVLAFGTSVKVGKNIALALYLFKYNEMFKDSIMALFNCRSVRINTIDYYCGERQQTAEQRDVKRTIVNA